jgi:dTDP-glucose 4,6-dehydratase
MPHLAAPSCLNFIEGDVRALPSTLDESFTHIIHAATASGAPAGAVSPLEMFDTIVAGTRSTLELAAKCGARRFLLASSGAVYGTQPPELSHLDEEYSGAPDLSDARSSYGEGKRAAELLCRLFQDERGLDFTVARGFAFVGPHLPLDVHFAAGNFLRDALRGGPIHINGDGTPLRSYLYAADMTVWLWTILLRGAAGRAYNLGSERALSMREIAQEIATCFEPSPEIVVARAAPPEVLPPRYIPSTRRARQELELEETIDFPQALRRTLKWLKQSL